MVCVFSHIEGDESTSSISGHQHTCDNVIGYYCLSKNGFLVDDNLSEVNGKVFHFNSYPTC